MSNKKKDPTALNSSGMTAKKKVRQITFHRTAPIKHQQHQHIAVNKNADQVKLTSACSTFVLHASVCAFALQSFFFCSLKNSHTIFTLPDNCILEVCVFVRVCVCVLHRDVF